SFSAGFESFGELGEFSADSAMARMIPKVKRKRRVGIKKKKRGLFFGRCIGRGIFTVTRRKQANHEDAEAQRWVRSRWWPLRAQEGSRSGGWMRYVLDGQGIFSRGASAGPEKTSPVGLKREPWQGQSQVLSAAFQWTMHFKCVQIGEQSLTFPSGPR